MQNLHLFQYHDTFELVIGPTERTPLVLLVDDEPCVISTLSAALQWAGFRVMCAQAPSVALAKALYTESPIDLLVTDILMPEMDGPELAHELSRYHPETKHLFIAARPDTEDVRLRVIGRGYPLLAKPFTARAFVAAVREALALDVVAWPAGGVKRMAASGPS